MDDSTLNLNNWTWGAAGRGAIILCNNDDDDNNRNIPPLVAGRAQTAEDPSPVAGGNGLDNTNDVIDTAADNSDIAPLEIRRHPRGRRFPAGWTARLTVSLPEKIRIFDGRAAGATQLIGPKTALPTLTNHAIANINFGTPLRYGMEAVSYPSDGIAAFDGLIDLTLETLDNVGAVQDTHVARVRVAPWLALHHLNPIRQVYVINDGVNLGHNIFRTDLSAAVTSAGVAAPTEATGATYRGDRWFRDVMKVGFSNMPQTGRRRTWRRIPVPLRTANNRAVTHNGYLDRFPWREMVGVDVGYTSPAYPFIAGSSLDSFGNLECSPPVHANGRNYRFGRIVYGDDPGRPMNADVVDHLTAQRVQEPFSIDTSWLAVGHVDEVISFCPMPSAPKKFKVLVASPDVAIVNLLGLQAAGNGAAPLCVAPQASPHWNPANYPFLTVDDVLNDAAFRGIQMAVQGLINTIEATLQTELGLAPSDFIRFPILFRDTGGGSHVAYLPGTVNMLVATKPDGTAVLCIPKPYGPEVAGHCQFERDIARKLQSDYVVHPTPPGPNKGVIRFIDDFFTYHELMGEIHCGTNEKRLPPTNHMWWDIDWL